MAIYHMAPASWPAIPYNHLLDSTPPPPDDGAFDCAAFVKGSTALLLCSSLYVVAASILSSSWTGMSTFSLLVSTIVPFITISSRM